MPPSCLKERFLKFIEENRLATSSQKILLAVSGGIDSMVMMHLFANSNFEFAVAHCNFLLRSQESDGDMEFVKAKANERRTPFFCQKFHTAEYAKQNKLSIQEAARELRYVWFSELLEAESYALVSTAHNLNDNIESLLINLSRGTGIRGLAGIPKKRENIIRPLLFATRVEIEEYAREHSIEYRIDSSNIEEKYLRNKLRHNIMPVFEESNSAFYKNFGDFFVRINQSLCIIDKEIERQKKLCVKKTGKGISIDIEKLLESQSPQLLLFEFLKDYGFNSTAIGNLFSSLKRQPGKIFFSKTHKATKDRRSVFVEPFALPLKEESALVYKSTSRLTINDIAFSFSSKPTTKGDQIASNQNLACLDMDKLSFPLEIRKIRKGDKMTPLGMKGRKKISDILIDSKVSLHKKEEIMVLVSGKEIAWLVGMRVSESFKISSLTSQVFMAKLCSR
jgi:tRNA(Ile)-lysidine synthase